MKQEELDFETAMAGGQVLERHIEDQYLRAEKEFYYSGFVITGCIFFGGVLLIICMLGG